MDPLSFWLAKSVLHTHSAASKEHVVRSESAHGLQVSGHTLSFRNYAIGSLYRGRFLTQGLLASLVADPLVEGYANYTRQSSICSHNYSLLYSLRRPQEHP